MAVSAQATSTFLSSTAGQVHLGSGDPCGSYTTTSRASLLRFLIKPLSSSSPQVILIVNNPGRCAFDSEYRLSAVLFLLLLLKGLDISLAIPQSNPATTMITASD
jgi:hypothetical protein